MSEFMNSRFKVVLITLAVTLGLGSVAHAQVSSTTGSGSQACQNGGWGWQVDQAPVTTTVLANASYNMPSNIPGGCLAGNVPPFVTLSRAMTVHEVHGNFSVTAFNTFTGTSSCANGSIIAEVRDQQGNTIAAVKLAVLGPKSTNVPINATFATPLSVTLLNIFYSADLCGPQNVSLALVMS